MPVKPSDRQLALRLLGEIDLPLWDPAMAAIASYTKPKKQRTYNAINALHHLIYLEGQSGRLHPSLALEIMDWLAYIIDGTSTPRIDRLRSRYA